MTRTVVIYSVARDELIIRRLWPLRRDRFVRHAIRNAVARLRDR